MVKQQIVRPMKRRESNDDRFFFAIVHIVIALILVVITIPILHVIAASFSDPVAVSSGKVFVWPVRFSLEGYRVLFHYSRIWLGYRNTIFYTLLGTAIQLIVTMIAAYPLSRKDLIFKKGYMALFMITMFFNGGMIPSYILIVNLGWYNTIWPLVIPGAVAVYRIIVTRTFIINSIPQAVFESAQIDGCSDAYYFTAFVLPLSKPIIAVSILFFAVGHWNAYFSAMMYLSDLNLQPLQMILRDVLTSARLNATEIDDPEIAASARTMVDLIKYALIIVSTLPVMMLYPFIQKYFVTGMMVGSVKG